ncbi:MAG: MarR family transcriptional regulator [Erysipelotrichaceae bacterium]
MFDKEMTHQFMEKVMNLQRISRRQHKSKHRMLGMMLVGIHSAAEGGIARVTQISEKLEITKAAATQMVDTLESQGYVERVYDDADKRVTLVKMTAKGKIELDLLLNDFSLYLDGLITYLGPEDTKRMSDLLDKMIDYTLNTAKGSEEKK